MHFRSAQNGQFKVASVLYGVPEKRTGIAHILEFTSPIVGNIFRHTLGFFLFVQPIIVPHSEEARYDRKREESHDGAMSDVETWRIDINKGGANTSKVTNTDDHS